MRKSGARNRRRQRAPVTFETVRRFALALPDVEEGTSYHTPAFRVRGKLFARLREDGETLAIRIDFFARDILMEANPASFFITDHYRAYPMMLVRLACVDPNELRGLIDDAWRHCAPQRLIAAHEGKPPPGGARRPRRA